MNKFKIMKKVIITSLTAALLMSSGKAAIISASTNDTAVPANVHTISQQEIDFKPGLTNDLEKLVDKKIIAKDQSKKIEEFMQKKKSERKAEHEKLKGMSKEERSKYLQDNMKKKTDLFSELVSQGIINKDQAVKMKTELTKLKEARLQETLKAEVAKGTISQEQLDKINTFLEKKRGERINEREKLRNMTDEEKKLYLYQHPEHKTDILTELMASGIITKEQSDALSRVLPQLHKGSHHKTVPGKNPNNLS